MEEKNEGPGKREGCSRHQSTGKVLANSYKKGGDIIHVEKMVTKKNPNERK